MRLSRFVFVAFLGFAALAFAAPALAATTTELDVFAYESGLGRVADTEFDLAIADSSAATAKASVYVPAGYTAALSAAPGTKIGDVQAQLSTPSGVIDATGTVMTDDPAKYTSQACAPGTHAAVWLLSVSVNGQPLAVPMYVDPAPAELSSRVSYVLQTCFAPPGASGGVKLSEADVDLPQVFTNPSAVGSYVWHALVTPYGAGDVPNAAGTTEVSAQVALPQRLTLRARYDRKRRRVVLTGTLVAAGKPRGGVNVRFRASTQPKISTLKPFGKAVTNAKGQFTFAHAATKTLYIDAYVNQYTFTNGCADAPLTAAPCTLESITPPPDALAVAKVPKKKKR